VWQSTWLAWNWIALERWQSRLASGMKLSAIGGSDFHQPVALQPEGPLVLARPTTVFWLPELSEDAVLAAMKSGHGYVTESPDGPHLEINANNAVMGQTTGAISAMRITTRGAAGDILALVDTTGEIARIDIGSDDFVTDIPISPKGFVRAEIIAGEATRTRMLTEFSALLAGRELPWQLRDVDIGSQPIRRALSNPIYSEA